MEDILFKTIGEKRIAEYDYNFDYNQVYRENKYNRKTTYEIFQTLENEDLNEMQELFDEGYIPDANIKNRAGDTLIKYAADKSYIKHIELLLKNGADAKIQIEKDDGEYMIIYCYTYAFQIAFTNKDYEIMEACLLHGALIDATGPSEMSGGLNSMGITALAAAVSSGNMMMINFLLDNGADINKPVDIDDEHHNYTPLRIACNLSDIDTARFLVAKGALLYVNGDYCLLEAYKSISITKMFMTICHADINRPNARGITALYHACIHNDNDAVKRFLRYGADPNLLLPCGLTLLSYMCQRNTVVVVKTLIANGADVNAVNADGTTALMQACMPTIVLASKNAARILLENGADVNAVDTQGRTALVIIAEIKCLTCLPLLLEYNIDVTVTYQCRKYKGCTVLDLLGKRSKALRVCREHLERCDQRNVQPILK